MIEALEHAFSLGGPSVVCHSDLGLWFPSGPPPSTGDAWVDQRQLVLLFLAEKQEDLRIESWINTRHIEWILFDFSLSELVFLYSPHRLHFIEVVDLNFSICKKKKILQFSYG